MGVVVLVAVACLYLAVSQALSGVFGVALYRYATTGVLSDVITEADALGAYSPKHNRHWYGS